VKQLVLRWYPSDRNKVSSMEGYGKAPGVGGVILGLNRFLRQGSNNNSFDGALLRNEGNRKL